MVEILKADLFEISEKEEKILVRNIPGKDARLFIVGSISATDKLKSYPADKAIIIDNTQDLQLTTLSQESLRIFERLHSTKSSSHTLDKSFRSSKSTQGLTTASQASNQYIRALKDQISTHPTPHMKSLKTIFSLASILMLDLVPEQILPTLLAWYKDTGVLTNKHIDAIKESPMPHLHPNYWQACARAMSVDPHILMKLLSAHPLAKQDNSIIQAIAKIIPQHAPTNREFIQWQSRVKAFSIRGFSDLSEDIKKFVGMLRGEEDSIKYFFPHWVGRIMITAIVKNPTLRIIEIAEMCEAYTEESQETLEDRLIFSVMSFDVNQTIVLASQYDSWLALHLVDLFIHANILNDEDLDTSVLEDLEVHTFSDIKNALIQTYAEFLCLQRADLIAMKYLLHLPNAHALISQLIQRLPLTTGSDSKQLLSFLKSHKLHKDIRYVYSLLARQAYDASDLESALVYYYFAQDMRHVTTVSHRLSRDVLSGAMSVRVANEIVGVVSSDKTEQDFLSTRDHHQCILNAISLMRRCSVYWKDNATAGKLLEKIVAGDNAPEFKCVLLDEALQLCGLSQVYLGVNGTFECMRCLEDVEMMFMGEEYEDTKSLIMIDKDYEFVSEMSRDIRNAFFDSVRIALVKNLGKAYLENIE